MMACVALEQVTEMITNIFPEQIQLLRQVGIFNIAMIHFSFASFNDTQ
jgi:hypothetical protein